MSDGRRAAWIQLAIFVIVVVGAVAVHRSSDSQFGFLLTAVFVGFLVIGIGALVWFAWRSKRGRDKEDDHLS